MILTSKCNPLNVIEYSLWCSPMKLVCFVVAKSHRSCEKSAACSQHYNDQLLLKNIQRAITLHQVRRAMRVFRRFALYCTTDKLCFAIFQFQFHSWLMGTYTFSWYFAESNEKKNMSNEIYTKKRERIVKQEPKWDESLCVETNFHSWTKYINVENSTEIFGFDNISMKFLCYGL